jgi:hypothetical protein
MKCIDFEDRLNEVLDLRLSPADDAVLQAHADVCADCRELLSAQANLFVGLAQLRRANRAPDFSRRVIADLRPEVVNVDLSVISDTSHSRRGWFTLLTSAAAIVLAVSVGVWVAGRNSGSRETVTRTPSRPKAGTGLAVAKPGTPLVKPAEVPQVSPPPAPLIVVVPALPPRSPALPGMDQAMASLASHWPQAGQWPPVETLNVEQVEHYAPGIRPIRESFGVALDALLKTLPGKKEPVQPTQPQALQPHGDGLNIA